MDRTLDAQTIIALVTKDEARLISEFNSEDRKEEILTSYKFPILTTRSNFVATYAAVIKECFGTIRATRIDPVLKSVRIYQQINFNKHEYGDTAILKFLVSHRGKKGVQGTDTHEIDRLTGLAAERWNKLHPENASDVKLSAERLRFECETTEDPNSGLAKDIMTLVQFAEATLS